MANPSTPSRASRHAPQSKLHRYIVASFTDDFGRQSKLTTSRANSFARKKLDTAAQSLQLRTERQEKTARRIEIREWRAAERSLAAELRESDHRIRMMWRSLRTRVRPEKKIRHTPPKERKRHWPYASVALPRYDGPVIDRSGQRGVFMRVRYYSRRTAEAGVSQRVVKYCFHGAELDPDGNPYVATNVGATIDEALCGFDHLEQVNWSAGKNAKLLMHGIFAVDHRQSPDEMMTCGVRWAEETLGRFDLPYLVTLHAPPPDGDERNWHLHILWSFRPMVRTGDHEWQVAEMLRTDLDNPKAMKVFREMFAAVMTDVSFEAGQNQVWTAKSNADRGLPHEPQVHLGGARTNRVRSGEYIAENEENHERVMRSKAAVIDDTLRHAGEALAKQQDILRSIATRWARLRSLPMQVPERIMAATISASLTDIGAVPTLSGAPIVVPARPPALRTDPTKIVGSLARVSEPPRTAAIKNGVPAPLPAAQPMRFEIANLRIQPPPLASGSIGVGTIPPIAPATTVVVSRLPPIPVVARRASIGIDAIEPPTVHVTPNIFLIPALSLTVVPHSVLSIPTDGVSRSPAIPSPIRALIPIAPPPALADPGVVDRALRHLDDVWNADRAQRKREREDTERAERDAQLTTDRQQALERLFLAIEQDRHYLALQDGRRTVDARLLLRFELTDDLIADKDVQARFEGIAERQSAELARIHYHVSRHPGQLFDDDGHWALEETAPADLRALVAAWRNDRSVQVALARVAKATPVTAAVVHATEDPAQPTQSAWRRARHLREKATAAWDTAGRLDQPDVALPGGRIARQGEDRAVDLPGVARPFRGWPGPGLGD